MDLSKVIDLSDTEFTKDVIHNKVEFSNLSESHPELFDKANEYYRLRQYSNILLENYHQALKEELAKNGIEI